MKHEQLHLERFESWKALCFTPESWAEMWEHAERARSNTEFVRSHYRAPWYGIVRNREKRKGCGDLLTILVVKDRRGNWVRKPYLTTLDEAWTTPCKPWRDPHAPYNFSIPQQEVCRRLDLAEQTLQMRKQRKHLRRKLRGFE